MEKIKMIYEFDVDGHKQTVEISHESEDSIHDYEACELFEDFVRAVGYSSENINKYFE